MNLFSICPELSLAKKAGCDSPVKTAKFTGLYNCRLQSDMTVLWSCHFIDK
jgi:hypothetical protein